MRSINETLFAKVDELKRRPFGELAQMASHEESSVECHEGHIALTVWKDAFEGSDIRIVVQAYQPKMLGIGTMRATGFRVTPNGIEELRKDDLAEFC
jgi:hypothetical protein